jgi:poly(A) polymerase
MVDERRAKADAIVRTLRGAGFKAYFAGGCVRDMIMKIAPRDYDIATDARPEAVIGLFDQVVPVGREFGVVVVVVDGIPFEVATFRREGPYLDGRRPSSVEYTDEEEDARRRDFTVNGLFYDPEADRVLDYVGGEADIRGRVIRSIGEPEARFEEDRLRLLRGVRFAARFRFGLEPATRTAIEAMAPRIVEVSAERLRDEIVKVLLDPFPHEGVRLLHRVGLLREILPEVAAMDGVEQPPEFHPEGDVLTHTLLMLEYMNPPETAEPGAADPGTEGDAGGPARPDRVPATPVLAMGVLLHDIGKPPTFEIRDRIRFNNHAGVGAEMAEAILRRLRFPRREGRSIRALVRDHLKFIEVRNMRESTLKRFLMEEDFVNHLELHRLDCLASHGDLSNWEFCRERLAALEAESPPGQRLVTGDDLIALGFTPGPLFKEILTYVEDLQLEGRVTTREEALDAVRARYGVAGGDREI